MRDDGLEDNGHVTYRWIIGALLREEDDTKIRDAIAARNEALVAPEMITCRIALVCPLVN